MRFCFTIVLTFIFSVSAFANSLPEAWDAALAGNYDTAAQMGTSLDTVDGDVLAASAIVAKILTRQSEDNKGDAKQAIKHAEAALEREPDNTEALLQYAVAYGILTRSSSNFTAWRKKMPQKSLAAILAAKEANPEDARIYALLGSWHLGILRKAGAERGEDMFGAHEQSGIDAFEYAVRLAPEDIVITMNYALSAIAFNAEKYQERGTEMMEIAEAQPAKSHIEETYKSWIILVLNLEEEPDKMQAMAWVLVDGEHY